MLLGIDFIPVRFKYISEQLAVDLEISIQSASNWQGKKDYSSS